MLGQRRRRWADSEQTLGQSLVFAEFVIPGSRQVAMVTVINARQTASFWPRLSMAAQLYLELNY